jgi:hypothetical protein
MVMTDDVKELQRLLKKSYGSESRAITRLVKCRRQKYELRMRIAELEEELLQWKQFGKTPMESLTETLRKGLRILGERDHLARTIASGGKMVYPDDDRDRLATELRIGSVKNDPPG